jgi:anti-anti-sigma factor
VIKVKKTSETEVTLGGRLDVATSAEFQSMLDSIDKGTITIDCSELEYVSSAGLRVFLSTQKRLKKSGGGLKIVKLPKDVYPIFQISGFDLLFEIKTK